MPSIFQVLSADLFKTNIAAGMRGGVVIGYVPLKSKKKSKGKSKGKSKEKERYNRVILFMWYLFRCSHNVTMLC